MLQYGHSAVVPCRSTHSLISEGGKVFMLCDIAPEVVKELAEYAFGEENSRHGSGPTM
jgi:hypothetical protein